MLYNIITSDKHKNRASEETLLLHVAVSCWLLAYLTAWPVML